MDMRRKSSAGTAFAPGGAAAPTGSRGVHRFSTACSEATSHGRRTLNYGNSADFGQPWTFWGAKTLPKLREVRYDRSDDLFHNSKGGPFDERHSTDGRHLRLPPDVARRRRAG